MENNIAINAIAEVQSTKEFLKGIAVPQATSYYKPVAHSQLMDLTLESIDKCGFILKSETYNQIAGGAKANGKYHLSYGNDPDMSIMIAWQNSYNKTLSLKFAIGGYVFICENGMVRGDLGHFKSKHQGEIQTMTPKILTEYISQAGETFEKMLIEKKKMQEIEVTKKTTAELLGRMYIEEGIITSTQLNIIKNELKTPTFNYGHPDSLWELYNYTTFSLKSANPTFWLQQQIDNHQFFTQEYGIAETV
jgi:hypothetical protein